MNPIISIIIPTFNAADFISSVLQSVTQQELQDVEVIVMDGGSQDGTHDIVREYEGDHRVKLHIAPDKGLYDAMNKGIDRASGEYLIFMGADDIFAASNTLKNVADHLRNMSPDVLYGNVRMKHSGEIYGGRFDAERLMFENICHQAIFYKRTLFDQLGKYDLKYFIGADWEFNLRWIANPKVRVEYMPEVIAIFNEKGASSMTSDGFLENKKQLIRDYYPASLLLWIKIKARLRKILK